MNIIISNTSGVPIYEQIKEQIKAAIFNEELKDGDLLPSIRKLAKELQISVITTMRAYNDLEQEGFIVSVQGKGSYVKPRNPELIKEKKLLEVEENLLAAINAARLVKLSQDDLISMLKFLIEEGDYE
ncbi:GntR family transcriptional regulator [Garciella nitratireducens]|uniref:GntR family transcriptional regulator n=1 Tax=Garciella nitratireducens TaxID=218205 RepID=UPI001BD62C3D|nr:GntR family transcriptional regulator [Garciella nitratireducens]